MVIAKVLQGTNKWLLLVVVVVLLELRANPWHLTLLCVLCEDFEGVLPEKRTQLFMEIVRCVLRRYEKNKKLSSSGEDPLTVYRKELIDLGRVALQSLHEGQFCFEESKLDSNSTVLIKSGLLSIQTCSTRRKPCLPCGFIHKSFQEFFASFYLAFQIADGRIDCDSVVRDERYRSELNQVFLFMSGIVALQSERIAVSLVKGLTAHINLLDRTSNDESEFKKGLVFAFDFILECKSHNESIQSELLHTLGRTLELKTLAVYFSYHMYYEILFESLKGNTCLNQLEIRSDCSFPVSLSDALKVNGSLTHLNLKYNWIDPSGASFLSDALKVNGSLTHLNLSCNGIDPSGASSLSDALKVNGSLTNLNLSHNWIDPSGASSLSFNVSLTHLDLSWNDIGDSGAADISEALKVNTCLTHLDLRKNEIGDSGAAAISEALKVNTCLTHLDLSKNEIGDSGAAAISEACRVNILVEVFLR